MRSQEEEEENEITLIEEIFHQPPEKKLIRIMGRVMTEKTDIRYVVIWFSKNEFYCTLESITNVLDYKLELRLLQIREETLDKVQRNAFHSKEKIFSFNEDLPDNTFFSNLDKDINIAKLDYWRIKRLEMLWLQTIRRYDINTQKKNGTPPLYIDGWQKSIYSNIPDFKYIIDGYAWSAKARAALRFIQKRKRNPTDCNCCACEKGCIRCGNSKGTFLRIENNLAVFPDCEDDIGEYYWTYECRHHCKCKTKCQYRMLKKGRKTPLIVTFHASKGWILRTLETIKKGQFITEFLGEIICQEEASERSTNYQMVMERGFYLDCDPYGNESRFISHSCDPNAAVVRIFGIKDSYVFRMAVVAKQEILQGSEITIDYHPDGDVDALTQEGSRCFCKAKACRKWL